MTRYIGPNGGTFSVKVGVAITQEYVDAMVKAGEWTPVDPDAGRTNESGTPATDKPIEKRTVPELKALAAEHGIGLDGLTKKPAILAAITAALAEAAAPDGAGDEGDADAEGSDEDTSGDGSDEDADAEPGSQD